MLHLAFTEEEVEALKIEGWKVHRLIEDPRWCRVMSNRSPSEKTKRMPPFVDQSAAMWLIQEAIRPTSFAPLSGQVLADTLRPGGQLSVLLARDRRLLFEALNPPEGNVTQSNVDLAELATWADLHVVIKDAVERELPLATVIIVDAEDKPLLLDFPLKTVALIVGYQARTENAMSQMQAPEDPGSEDATSH